VLVGSSRGIGYTVVVPTVVVDSANHTPSANPSVVLVTGRVPAI